MRYLLMIYEDPATAPRSPDAWNEMLADYGAYTEWLAGTGQLLGGEALKDVSSATTVTVRDGRRLVTDGPFAETKEHLGGYYLIEAADLDAAIDAAARVPGARLGKVEIRPILEMG
ncbi:MAG: YciI family protein [Chloroflexota bacterium]